MWLSSWTINHRHDLLTTAASRKVYRTAQKPVPKIIDLTKAFDSQQGWLVGHSGKNWLSG